MERTTDTFLFISHTTNVLLFKFLCNIFIGVRIIKEMPGSVAIGTPCICPVVLYLKVKSVGNKTNVGARAVVEINLPAFRVSRSIGME